MTNPDTDAKLETISLWIHRRRLLSHALKGGALFAGTCDTQIAMVTATNTMAIEPIGGATSRLAP